MSPGPQLVLFERELTPNRRKQKNRKDRPGGRNIKCKAREMKTSTAKASEGNGETQERRSREG